ncbi:class I SAM-dependent methyltransferase [Bacillus sp. 3255]|uniref:class I SAM-dependent methyltransferase n=1 Tax=Bacillus sp. 3255 TaxID=2817904 RepID=UPI0028546708|nr:class I SAM-dependent methyltransferase [Bacillus sp. 3255]MDR6879963.1 2-polyprenyl-3-methyl-5-hydroxy-6-metoxy-1,4-benzoquinol methylase [Bacillus sp. 3255]
MEPYWNHNTAFHNELVNDAKTRGGRVLDIGCGDGLLLQRLAPVARQVVGIDPDPQAIVRAQARLAAASNVSLINDDFLTWPVPAKDECYATISCVAALHHMDLRVALSHIRRFLSPGGRMLIVGLAANKTLADYAFSGLCMLPIRLMDCVRGGVQEIGVRLAEPQQSLSEIVKSRRTLCRERKFAVVFTTVTS